MVDSLQTKVQVLVNALSEMIMCIYYFFYYLSH